MNGSILKVAGVEALQQNILETKAHLKGMAVSGLSDVVLTNLQGGQVIKYDAVLQKWVNRNDESGGGGLKVGDVSGATATTTAGTASVTLIWTDPNDVEVSGVALAEWAGTLVVRKAGSVPTNKDDGTIVVNEQTRNQYSTNGFTDNSVSYGTTYYYRFFPYTTGDLYTDGSSVSATATRATVSIPTPTGDLTYDGTVQTMTFDYDSTKVALSGNTGTNAGTTAAVAHLIDSTNNEWSDHTTEDKYIDWTIKKATGGCTLTPSSITLDTSHSSGTSTISNATGTVTGVTSGTPASVSATLSGSTITVTGLDSTSQTVNVTVSIAESDNYNAATATLKVVCSYLAIVTWSGGTDAQIAAMLDAHYAGQINIHDYWKVGDERSVSLSAMSATGVGESHVAQTVTMVLMNVGGKTLQTPINGISTCAFIVGQKNMLANGTSREGGYMNSSNVNAGGWDSCARRTWCNSVYRNAIPSTLRSIFKQHKNKTSQGSTNHSAVTTSVDYFALPSEKEVLGSVTYANSTAESGNTQFKYYETSANRVKKAGNSGSASIWWERSPGGGNSNGFCDVSSSGGARYNGASNTGGLAPFGCI